MSTDYVHGIVEIRLADASGRIIHPNQHPLLYGGNQARIDHGVDGGPFIRVNKSVSVDRGVFEDLKRALEAYEKLGKGLASLISSLPDLSDVANIFEGFRDAVSVVPGEGELKKFVRDEIELRVPYPHPSGLSSISLTSHGSSVTSNILPDLLADPTTGETPFPGVRVSRAFIDTEQERTSITFDLEQIAHGSYWRAFFINDGGSENGEFQRFFPMMYWFRRGEAAVLLAVKLQFIRYNLAPETITRLDHAFRGDALFASKPFVHDYDSGSIYDGYIPSDSTNDREVLHKVDLVRWKDGKLGVKLLPNRLPKHELVLEAETLSRRLRYPGAGTQLNWRTDLNMEVPPGLEYPQWERSTQRDNPNFEGHLKLTKRIRGIDLEPGQRYFFKINILDGDYTAFRTWMFEVEEPETCISSITPRSILPGEKIKVRGNFGNYVPDEFGGAGVGLVFSVSVGDEEVSWEQAAATEIMVGPITKGGPVIVRFQDGSTVTSSESVGIGNHLGLHPIITSIQPTTARAGESIVVRGQNFLSGSGDAVQAATFTIAAREHTVEFINSTTVQIRIEEWTNSGYVSAQFDGGIGTSVSRFIKLETGPRN